MKKKLQQKNSNNTDQAIGVMHTNALTEVAGEGGTDWTPQNFLSSQQFRHLIRCTKHFSKPAVC